jgi:hypothetical protein
MQLINSLIFNFCKTKLLFKMKEKCLKMISEFPKELITKISILPISDDKNTVFSAQSHHRRSAYCRPHSRVRK